MTGTKRIVLNVAATYGRSLYTLLCGLFTCRWILAFLGETDYGLYGVVGGLTVFIGFINSILGNAVSRYYAVNIGRSSLSSSEEGLKNSCEWFNTALMIHTVVPIILLLIGYPLGMKAVKCWLTIPPERVEACVWVFRMVCISCLAGMVNVPFNSMYIAKQCIAELTVYSFCTTTLNMIVFYYMVTHPSDWLVRYAVWMCLSTSIPQLIICIRAFQVFPECRIRVEYMWSLARIRNLVKYAGSMMFGALGEMMRFDGVQIVLNKYFGPSFNAAYALSVQVGTQAQMLSHALTGAFHPVIFAACGAGKMQEALKMSFRASKFGTLLWLVVLIPLALELPNVLKLWLVNPPEHVTALCYFALIAALIQKFTIGHYIILQGVGKIAAFQYIFGSCMVLTAILCWGLVIMGMEGVSAVGVALISTMFVYAIGRVLFARKMAGMSIGHFTVKVMLPIIASALLPVALGLAIVMMFKAGFLRLVMVSVLCNLVFMPLVFKFVLDDEERGYVQARVLGLLRRRK